VVEALGVAPVLIVGLIYGISAQSLALISASWVLIASAGIDYQVGILPDRAAYIVLWGGLLASMGYRQGFALIPLTHAVLGVVLGYGLLWCISRGYYVLTRVHGMGEGDLKYLAAMGAGVGWEGIPGLLLLGALAGIVAIALRSALCGRKPTEALHFGPALCAGWFATVALHPMPNVLVLGHLLSWSI
jgi:leader peptidase (prepilin peptidase)/N-methyltransferase